MPKDATKNIDRYKVRGGQFNEFEYSENQKALAGKKGETGAKLIPGTPPEEAGDGLQPAVKATSKATKTTKATKKARSTKGVSAKKLAARKAATKK
ncbi:MAG: hypothetical protein V7638_2895 [Acidobacteriota bacterium]|jgi:hypothetical protein